MKTYQNNFELLGDPLPTEAASEREYAKSFLPMFVRDEDVERPGTWYRIDEPLKGWTGYACELEWQKRVYEATEDKAQYDWEDEGWSGVIEEQRLLDFLEEAVGEKQ